MNGDTKPPHKTLEKANARHMLRQLQLRLQYAKLKVDHGWQKQHLNEVENLYFRQQKDTLNNRTNGHGSVTVDLPVLAAPLDSQDLIQSLPGDGGCSSLSFKLPLHLADAPPEAHAHLSGQPMDVSYILAEATEPPRPDPVDSWLNLDPATER